MTDGASSLVEGGRTARVVVVGAGGLGSYVGAVLTRRGHEVTLVIRGDHGDAVRREGLRVDAQDGSFVTHPACALPGTTLGAADFVLVSVKAYSLDEVAPLVADLARKGAVVVPLLNGVDVAERLESAGVPPDRIVDGVAYLTAFRTGPGRIERKGAHQRLVVGSASGRSHLRVGEVVELFRGTPVEVVPTDDILLELWLKMAVVCSLAAICGMTDSALGPIRAHPLGPDLQDRAIAEVLAVGRGRGVALPPDAEKRVGDVLDAFPEDFYPSVLHDLRAGRRTEMDQLGGTLTRMGRAGGVETPVLDAATCAVALVEARRRASQSA